MIPLVRSREMRAIDEATIRDHVPGIKLMEWAGGAVKAEIVQRLGHPKKAGGAAAGSRGAGRAGRAKSARAGAAGAAGGGKSPAVVVICGKGNNGGDGFVVSRLLKEDGFPVKTFLVGKADEVKGDALTNLKRLKRLRHEVAELETCGIARLEQEIDEADVVVDAIFGTGFEGRPRGLAARVIEAINGAATPIIAVDMPSGVDATTGDADAAVAATVTVTMGLPKVGQVLYPGKSLTGELVIADIGIPDEVIAAAGIKSFLLEPDDVLAALPIRPPDAHKWSCGHVACIAGSVGFTGAATLTAHASLRAGAGLATLAIPRSLNTIMEVKLTEVMTLPVDETSEGTLAASAIGALNAFVARANCVAIGPGLGRAEETAGLVRALIPALGRPCVLDADGLNAFAGRAGELRSLATPLVITPHAGEAARLFGVDKGEIAGDPLSFASGHARDLGVVMVLKGAPTIIAAPTGETYVNPSGNQGLATAGSGDVLTGTIAGLVAQGLSPLGAAYAGVFIHGVAGDLLLAEKGHFGYLASEIADRIPEAIASLSLDEGEDDEGAGLDGV